jgi:riboflavin biosynthesis pyrimidine reductase
VADVQQRIAELYGDVDLARCTGVVHVVAVWEGDDEALRVIRIGPSAPKSPTDAFVLQLARARADAIVTTGKILRAEPALHYALPPDLLAWRREHMRLEQRPDLIVLTRGHDLDLAHPALHGWAQPIVFTTEAAADRLDSAQQVRAVGHVDLSLRTAIDWAVAQGARVVCIEAGPSSAATLYDSRVAVDELMLSEFLGELALQARGGVLMHRDQLEAKLRLTTRPRDVQEESGPWRFSRWTRDPRR